MKKLILIGGGGHCVSCIDVIEAQGLYLISGILDVGANVGSRVLNYDIIGTDNDLYKYVHDHHFLITVGQTKTAATRKAIFETLQTAGGELAIIISPFARVSQYASIGAGTCILHNACVNANVRIGVNCIINTGSNVEHDCTLGNHVHISTQAVVNGGCQIKEGCFVGSNATIVQNVTIAANSLIGAGAVILHSFLKRGTFIGNPAKGKLNGRENNNNS